MKKKLIFLALVAVGCGVGFGEFGSETTEGEDIASTDQMLSSRLRTEFGPKARVQRVFGKGQQMLVGVAVEDAMEATDHIPGMAIASYDPRADKLDVVEREVVYREARRLGNDFALLTQDGELRLRGRDGSAKVLAKGVYGDIYATADGNRVAFTARPTRTDVDPDVEASITLVDRNGNSKRVADLPGQDSRPMVSPDGKTVVFIADVTGVASFFRTTVDGETPVQLTNIGIAPGISRDAPPAGFVPPPISNYSVEWVSADVLKYNAGDAFWTINVRTGAAAPVGGAQ
jgi:hypothetical protein